MGGRRRRTCLCKEVDKIDYKDVSVLRRYITDRGRMESGKKSGNCAKCQRELSKAISRARHLALLPSAPTHLRVTGVISPTASQEAEEPEEEEMEAVEELDGVEELADEIAVAGAVEDVEDYEGTEESEEDGADVEPSDEDDSSDDDAESAADEEDKDK